MNYNPQYNAELKNELKVKGIPYKELASHAGYSLQTINYWMARPLTAWRELIIRGSMVRIEKSSSVCGEVQM